MCDERTKNEYGANVGMNINVSPSPLRQTMKHCCENIVSSPCFLKIGKNRYYRFLSMFACSQLHEKLENIVS